MSSAAKSRFRQSYGLGARSRSFGRPSGIKSLAALLRQSYALFAAKIWFKAHVVQDGSRSNSHRCLRAIPEFSNVNAPARFAINLLAVPPSTADISAADSAGSALSPTPSRTSGIARRWETYSCTASRSRRNRSGEASFADTSPTSSPPPPTISVESLTALDTLRA